MTIYVTVQPGNIARMRPVLSLFFDALVNLNTDVVPEDDPTIQWQTLVMLDEFIRLGKMESLSRPRIRPRIRAAFSLYYSIEGTITR